MAFLLNLLLPHLELAGPHKQAYDDLRAVAEDFRAGKLAGS